MSHKIKTTNSSTLLLVNILSSAGWAKSIEDIVVGGSLLVEVFGDFKPQPAEDGKTLDESWAVAEAEWELSEKQRECCKRAILSVVAEKKMPVAKTSYQLVKAFGLE